jgi:hypothetical protein
LALSEQRVFYNAAVTYYTKAGGNSANSDLAAYLLGSSEYTQRDSFAAVNIARLYEMDLVDLHLDAGDYSQFGLAYFWYELAIKRGWVPPKPTCQYGHTVDGKQFMGPISHNGNCHSIWLDCDPLPKALLQQSLLGRQGNGQNIEGKLDSAFTEPLIPSGHSCKAVCIAALDGFKVAESLAGFAVAANFECGDDGECTCQKGVHIVYIVLFLALTATWIITKRV